MLITTTELVRLVGMFSLYLMTKRYMDVPTQLSEQYNPSATIDNGTCEYIAGCRNLSATNYNPDADYDDGSCEFDGEIPSVPETQVVYGCMDAAAQSTYNPNATQDDGSCVYNAGCLNSSANNYDETADYDNGTCTFDGEIQSVPETQVVYGCMDAAAQSTYNPNATQDDGSCVYNAGCLNSLATNYNPDADYDDGSCEFDGEIPSVPETQVVYGCMDAAAQSTYNPDATQDDGSCLYNGGCMNPDAENFTEGNDYDDGSCDFGEGQVYEIQAEYNFRM